MMKEKHSRLQFLILLGVLFALNFNSVKAASFNDIDFWTGEGENRAAMVIHWSSPENFDGSDLPTPSQDKVMGWGYRFDGEASGQEMLDAVVKADTRLYATIYDHPDFGEALQGFGYDWNGDGQLRLTDGDTTFDESDFTDGKLAFANDADADRFYSVDEEDLYWAGWFGPSWESWREDGLEGGFETQPDRGSDTYWDSENGKHGDWEFVWTGDDSLQDGSWLGWSVARGAFGTDEHNHKQAPKLIPEPGTFIMLILGGLALLGRHRRL